MVEVSPGTVLLFEDVPDGLDFIPFSLISPADRAALSDAVLRSTGVLNVGAQVAPALAQAQDVVRLAPETLAALRAGATPIQSGGYNLGTLAANGKFATSVRWLPAAGATAAGVAAAIGPALAMVAIQAQLVEHKAWFQYQALLAAMARQRGDDDELEAHLAESLPDTIHHEYDEVAAQMAILLDAVLREAWILAELPGKRTLPFTGARRSAREVALMAKPLSDAVTRLASMVGLSEPDPVPLRPLPPRRGLLS